MLNQHASMRHGPYKLDSKTDDEYGAGHTAYIQRRSLFAQRSQQPYRGGMKSLGTPRAAPSTIGKPKHPAERSFSIVTLRHGSKSTARDQAGALNGDGRASLCGNRGKRLRVRAALIWGLGYGDMLVLVLMPSWVQCVVNLKSARAGLGC